MVTRAALLIAGVAACTAFSEARPEARPEPNDVRTMVDTYAATLIEPARASEQAGLYAPSFILGEPVGTVVIANGQQFRIEIEEQAVYLRDTLGMTSVAAHSIETISLHDHHVVVKVVFACTFRKTADRSVLFPVTFMIDRAGVRPAFVAHIVEADEPKIFRELGLIETEARSL